MRTILLALLISLTIGPEHAYAKRFANLELFAGTLLLGHNRIILTGNTEPTILGKPTIAGGAGIHIIAGNKFTFGGIAFANFPRGQEQTTSVMNYGLAITPTFYFSKPSSNYRFGMPFGVGMLAHHYSVENSDSRGSLGAASPLGSQVSGSGTIWIPTLVLGLKLVMKKRIALSLVQHTQKALSDERLFNTLLTLGYVF